MIRITFLAASMLLAVVARPASAGMLTGAGGTAIYPVFAQWAARYHAATGEAINYQPIGSGGGIAQIEARTIDFANTDKPLTPEALAAAGLVQYPALIVSIVPIVNLPGVSAGEIVLDGATLAGVFLGKFQWWDDPAMRRLNPGVALPHLRITTVHRSDGSGTTFNFTNYLSKVSPEWRRAVGNDVSVSWPVGVGGKGNAGVANYVKQVSGAIGYVEYAYVLQNRLAYARMVNRDGKVVAPAVPGFQAAAANADFAKVRDFYLILTDQPGPESWPITAATYMLMRKDAAPERNLALLRFMDWTLRTGQDEATALGYVPLPAPVIRLVEQSWRRDFKAADGRPLWTLPAE